MRANAVVWRLRWRSKKALLHDSRLTQTSRAGAVVALFAVLAIPAGAGTDDEYQEAIATIRCDCGCHPQSVEDCSCGRADQMRAEIGAMVRGTDGRGAMTADAVVAQYVAEQGEQIRIAPSTSGFSLVAWLGPLIGLVLGLFAALALVRHLARSAGRAEKATEIPVPESAVLDADDPYRAKLRSQLDEWN